jgi:molybdenum cofactor cytidylyltransferase
MQTHEVHTTLTGALGVGAPQLIALVGAGGKTTALHRLVAELAGAGSVLATTTTAMFSRQLDALGPVLFEDAGEAPLSVRAGEALRGAGVVAVAASRAEEHKVRGLSPAQIDRLWRERTAGSIVVEADGSRGLPLKAFGTAEPQVPFAATTVVVLAGLDVLGRRLDEKHVHRADLLASALGVTRKTRVTPGLLSGALALQVATVRATTPQARVVVLLNKAESDREAEQGAAAAADLLAAAVSSCGQAASGRPDRVVVGSLVRGDYRVFER